MFTKITTIYKNKENQYKRKIYSRIFILYGLKRLASFRQQQGNVHLFQKFERYSLFQTFRQSTFCDSFYEFFSFFLIAVRKLKTGSRRV